MKVNITSNNSIVRPIPGTKFMTPVYGKDIQNSTIIRLLNFPALRIYDTATGIAVTKKNINTLLNTRDHAVDPVKEVVPAVEEEKHITHKKKSVPVEEPKTEIVEEAPVETETVAIEEPIVVEEPVEEETIEAVDEPTDAVEAETVEEPVEATEVEAVDEVPVVKPQQTNNRNRNRNKNKH